MSCAFVIIFAFWQKSRQKRHPFVFLSADYRSRLLGFHPARDFAFIAANYSAVFEKNICGLCVELWA